MSDLELHQKALVYLMNYYESEQWSPTYDESNILVTNSNVVKELEHMKTHIFYYHDDTDGVVLFDEIKLDIEALMHDDKVFRNLFADKLNEVE